MQDVCGFKGCERPVHSRGACRTHYVRLLEGRSIATPIREVFRGGDDIVRIKSKVTINAVSECWEWNASRTPGGYGQMRFRGTRWLSHRVSWTLFKGEIPEGPGTYKTLGVLHKCDNPCCINPDHLFLGDQKSNIDDSVNKERWGKRGCIGEKHGRAALNEVKVREIRASGLTYSELAEKYLVSKSTIQHVIQRRSWAHIE